MNSKMKNNVQKGVASSSQSMINNQVASRGGMHNGGKPITTGDGKRFSFLRSGGMAAQMAKAYC
jgi:hypothetical protein